MKGKIFASALCVCALMFGADCPMGSSAQATSVVKGKRPVMTNSVTRGKVIQVSNSKRPTPLDKQKTLLAKAKTTPVKTKTEGRQASQSVVSSRPHPLVKTREITGRPKTRTIHPTPLAGAHAAIPVLRVNLGSRSTPATLSNTSGITAVKSDGKTVRIGSSAQVKARAGKVYINGKNMGTSVLLKDEANKGAFSGLSRTYRGNIRVQANGSAMNFVNEIPMEDYLYGVVAQEAVQSWPAAALEAQAVAARTYALYAMNQNKDKAYDVELSDASQVYAGKDGEAASTTRAVDATRGIIMTYGGRPIDALFHSDGGGYTEDSVNVWGNDLPYLKGVKDYSNHVGTTTWVETTNRKAIESKLNAAGKGVGTLKVIQLSGLKAAPMRVADRGVSGRIKSATFVGTQRKITVSGENLRAILGLKSSLFDFYVGHKPPQKENGKTYHTFSKKNDIVYIQGHGWGHGLGLSQWGAAEMARQHANQTGYYQTILRHYYKGIDIVKWY